MPFVSGSASIVDIGAGTGLVAEAATQTGDPALVMGVDPSAALWRWVGLGRPVN